MQFDKAEFGAPGPAGASPSSPATVAATACAACKQPLTQSYYDVGGQPLCEACSRGVTEAWNARKGSVLAAIGRGLIAAVLGAVAWTVITRVSGYEIGIVAIVIGAVIGNAVKKASGGHGGRAFQVVAVVLTYLACTSHYVPQVWGAVTKGALESAARKSAAAHQKPAEPGADTDASAADPNPPAGAPSTPEPTVTSLGPVVLVLLALVSFAFSLAGPFLGGFDNVFGILILGFALLQAWRINKRVELKIHGPFVLSPVPAAAALPAAAAEPSPAAAPEP
jgi:hypothetical protein